MVTPNRDDKQNTSAKACKLYTTMLTKFDCVVQDDETYVKADFKQLPGQEFYTVTGRGKVADIFKDIKRSKFTKEYMLWLEEQHLHCDRNIQPGNLCEQVPSKTSTAFPEATQLLCSVLAGFGILS